MNRELVPYLYKEVHLSVLHPSQALRWIARIGQTSSSCIQYLVLRLTSLSREYTEEQNIEDREIAWSLALRSMPQLSSIDFHFEQDNASLNSTPLEDDFRAIDLEMLGIPTDLASSGTNLFNPAPHPTKADSWTYIPTLHHRPIGHAIISISEPMPSILIQYFNQVLSFKSISARSAESPLPTSSLNKDSLDQIITGLPPSFFTNNNFHLHRTCAFNENNENASALLTYRRFPKSSKSPASMLEPMFKGLSNLQYLRLGCRHLNSDFLAHVPKRLHTLDVAFTDNDPSRIAENLMTMRGICKKLFTLAIAVSPLHDRDHAGEDETHEVFFDRRFVSKDVEEMWEPFWTALDEIKESKVKVWEGEGPGFKR
ncbi:MAG: hypothetical protein Q9164_001272 [Protoblastenia rupestris]